MQIVNASRDVMFPPADYHEVYRRLLPIYDLYGAAAKIAEFDFDSGHSDIFPYQKQAIEWISRWVRGDAGPFEEQPFSEEDAGLLRVLARRPADAINERIDRSFIPVHTPRPWTSLAAWRERRAELLASLQDRVFRAFPAERDPAMEAWKEPDGSWARLYADAYRVEFTSEPGARLTGKLCIPRGERAERPALIYVRRREDLVYPIDQDRILSLLSTHVVLDLRPRGVDYPMDNYRLATVKRSIALLGATLESMQAWDILRGVDYLLDEQRLELSSISVFGAGEMGALGIYAAALDSRITRVILENPPSTHWQGPVLLNVLRLTNLPEAAALLAPRELVSLTPLPEAYGYTRSVYALHDAAAGIREARSLAAALRVWQYD